ncbi:hypothetical protein [Pseudomonas sp. CFBP 5748]
MDFPKSIPSVGLVDGKFVDEDLVAGTPGSLIPAQWGNAVTEEVLNVITSGGLVPNEDNNAQLLAAITMKIAAAIPAAPPAASASVRGLVELATNAETQAGADTERAVTAAGLASRTATESRSGIVQLATQAQVSTGTDDATAVTPLKLAANQAATGATSFARRLANFRDIKPLGTAGGTYTTGAWRTRDLNTAVVNNIPGATLTSNQLTLPAGTYFLMGQSAIGDIYNARLRLYNVTDSIAVLEGIGNGALRTGNLTNSLAHIMGSFILSASKVVELQMNAAVTSNGTGMGYALSLGSNEVYSDITLWRLF